MLNIAVVSGASSGIGREIAIDLSDKGWEVLCLGRNEAKLSETMSQLKTYASSITVDLTQSELVQEKINSWLNIKDRKKRLKGLVNNAGAYLYKSFEDTTIEEIKEQFETNTIASANLTKIIWPYFIKNKSGSIVNISSTLGLRPIANSLAYSMSKSALNNFTESLALEGAPHNIRANCICPGVIDTPIHSFHKNPKQEEVKKFIKSLHPLNSIGTPSDIAKACSFLLGTDSAWTTGAILKVDGGIHLTSKS